MQIVISGCLNGGGQLRPEGEDTPKELLTRVTALYNEVKCRRPEAASHVENMYEWMGGEETEKAKNVLHTRYHEVEKMANALTIKW